TVLIVALGAAVQVLPPGQAPPGPVLAWFALPLLLTLSGLAIARIEVHPYTRWASAEGQRLLGSLIRVPDGSERGFLTAVAVAGHKAIDDPRLRAALTGGGR
ncbi:TIGR04222 domain-containing membrane protein, partial [Streptomyces sp. NPDC055078]